METNEEMTQENENNTNSPDSGGECCSPDSGKWKSLKTAVFVLVILAACAVAAHSVLSNGTNSPCGGSAAALCPLNKPCASSSCDLKAASSKSTTCLIEEKENTPSSCCPSIENPGCCPSTEIPANCPKTQTSSGCPKTAAVPGCCPSITSE
jgi:hypothetical protein